MVYVWQDAPLGLVMLSYKHERRCLGRLKTGRLEEKTTLPPPSILPFAAGVDPYGRCGQPSLCGRHESDKRDNLQKGIPDRGSVAGECEKLWHGNRQLSEWASAKDELTHAGTGGAVGRETVLGRGRIGNDGDLLYP